MTPKEIKAMPAAEVAEQLQEHLKWRRGLGRYRGMSCVVSPHDHYDFGLILDRAIQLLKEMK